MTRPGRGESFTVFLFSVAYHFANHPYHGAMALLILRCQPQTSALSTHPRSSRFCPSQSRHCAECEMSLSPCGWFATGNAFPAYVHCVATSQISHRLSFQLGSAFIVYKACTIVILIPHPVREIHVISHPVSRLKSHQFNHCTL